MLVLAVMVHMLMCAPMGGDPPFAPGDTWVPLDNMPLGCHGQALLLACLAAIEDIEGCGRQPW